MATFFNQATLSYNGILRSSNITAGEILAVLSATKTPVTDTYTPGSEETYVINLVNTGSSCYDNVTVTDDLGAYTVEGDTDPAFEVVPLTYVEGSVKYFVNGVRQADPVVQAVSPLTVTGLKVPAGGNAALVYSATVNEFAPLGADASITNTAALSGDGFADIEAQAVITNAEELDLEIIKALSPAAVEENGQVTYTFTIQNNGTLPAEAADDVIFSDVFDPILSSLTAEFNGAAWSEGTNYTYDEATGTFTSLAGQITVPAAVYTQDPATGVWAVQPGISTLVITGNLASANEIITKK